ncbi:MAG: Response regulator receiver protein [Planctomycetaceae bacterium]|nr:Response regulator receiver protein [Planctomycetaceae bacterium]
MVVNNMSIPILLVDDNPEARSKAAKLLWIWGYQVDVANNVAAALTLAENKDYTLAIIDEQIHGMNGVELFRRMREFRHDLMAIILIGKYTHDFVYPGIEAGIVSVLPKPTDFYELLPIIEECIGIPK